MTPLSNQNLVRYWELATDSHPIDRALLGLAIANANKSYESLAQLSIGQRDILLMEMYQATFGSSLCGVVDCPDCGTELQFDIDTRNILNHSFEEIENSEFSIKIDNTTYMLRLPNSHDLAYAIKNGIDNASQVLAEKCITIVPPQRSDDIKKGMTSNKLDISEAGFRKIKNVIEERDPYLEIMLDFSCDECGLVWSSVLDIFSFLWAEVSSTAKHLLNEVHIIAMHYGWKEKDILSMNYSRRQYYINLIDNMNL